MGIRRVIRYQPVLIAKIIQDHPHLEPVFREASQDDEVSAYALEGYAKTKALKRNHHTGLKAVFQQIITQKGEALETYLSLLRQPY